MTKPIAQITISTSLSTRLPQLLTYLWQSKPNRMIKTITRLFICFVVLTLVAEQATAQDIHFSQFYAAPTLHNPAMTGYTDGNGRAMVIYRNQYSALAPYSTVGAAFDMSLLGCQMKRDHIGIGVVAYNDRSGVGQFNTLSGLLSLAYHKGLDSDGRYLISLGAQAGYTQKSVDFTRLLFESQIVNFEFDPTVMNGEQIYNNSFYYFDFVGGGLLSAAISDQVSLYGGGSYHHIQQPSETFLVSTATSDPEILILPSRITLNGGGQFGLSDVISISPSALFQKQGTSTEIVYGAALGFRFDQNNRYRRSRYDEKGTALYLGAWNRWNDALIFYLGVDLSDLSIGFSYDVTISPLASQQGTGGIEVSLTYGFKTSECNKQDPLYCPRF